MVLTNAHAGGARERRDASLSALTTIGLGGRARRVVEAVTEEQVIGTVARADAGGEPVLVLGGGSNVEISDAGFDGTVIRIHTRGITVRKAGRCARLHVAAGEPWDQLVARCVARGLAGIECLSGIPGTTGATPIQNVGAYGKQVGEVIGSVRVYDREARAVAKLSGRQCEFGYRSSLFRHGGRYVVLGIELVLVRSWLARPIHHAGLTVAVASDARTRPSLVAVRQQVLALRRSKGMVIDADDPDTRSVGSFFLNPLLAAEGRDALERRVARRLGSHARPPTWPDGHGRAKTSAAWLVEHAGFRRGYGLGPVAISTKHALALVNRGGVTTAELLVLARMLQDGVRETFGITLDAEPTLVGCRV